MYSIVEKRIFLLSAKLTMRFPGVLAFLNESDHIFVKLL